MPNDDLENLPRVATGAHNSFFRARVIHRYVDGLKVGIHAQALV